VDGTAEEARPTRAEQKENTDRALLDAAAEVIAERDIARAPFSTISERAGISRTLTTVYDWIATALNQ
jgi:AcrR family transcriptional regulator